MMKFILLTTAILSSVICPSQDNLRVFVRYSDACSDCTEYLQISGVGDSAKGILSGFVGGGKDISYFRAPVTFKDFGREHFACEVRKEEMLVDSHPFEPGEKMPRAIKNKRSQRSSAAKDLYFAGYFVCDGVIALTETSPFTNTINRPLIFIEDHKSRGTRSLPDKVPQE